VIGEWGWVDNFLICVKIVCRIVNFYRVRVDSIIPSSEESEVDETLSLIESESGFDYFEDEVDCWWEEDLKRDLAIIDEIEDEVLPATFRMQGESDDRWLGIIQRYVALESNIVMDFDLDENVDTNYLDWMLNVTVPATYTFELLSEMRPDKWFSLDYFSRYSKLNGQLNDEQNMGRIRKALDRLVEFTHKERYGLDFVVERDGEEGVSYRVVRRQVEEVSEKDNESSSEGSEEEGRESERGKFVPMGVESMGRVSSLGSSYVEEQWKHRLCDHSVFSREKERDLIRRAQAGDLESRNELVEHNIKLVRLIMERFGVKETDTYFFDCLQEGTIALFTAIRKFDLVEFADGKFSTYAGWWIRQAVTRYIEDRESGNVRRANWLHYEVNKVKSFTASYKSDFGKYPPDDVVQEFFEYSDEKMETVKNTILNGFAEHSNELDSEDGGENESFTLADTNTLNNGESFYFERDMVIDRSVDQTRFQLLDVLLGMFEAKVFKGGQFAHLAKRDLYMFARYCPDFFPFVDFVGADSSGDIADECGCSKEYVRQVYTPIFKKLEARLHTPVNLRSFMTHTHNRSL